MLFLNIKSLTKEQRIKLFNYVTEQKGITYNDLGISKATGWRYKKGEREIPDDVIERAIRFLTLDEAVQALYGEQLDDANINDLLKVVITAIRNPNFRSLLFLMLDKYLGEYVGISSNSYIVTGEDLKLFERVLKDKAERTREERLRHIRHALRDLNYRLTSDGLKEYILKLMETEGPNVARHRANTLKLFIKEVVRVRNPILAQLLYNSFKTPKGEYKYKPPALSLDTLRKIFDNITHKGAKAFFLILAETGLRVGEVYSLTLSQLDFDNRVIKLMKEGKTKRAYVSFIHENTVKWLKDEYLPYREEFIKKHEFSVIRIGVDVNKWKEKFFPFQISDLRKKIREGMRRVGIEFRLYDLRSFFASYMLKQGVSPMIVNILQGRVPPSEFKILQQHYFVISEVELQKIYDEKAPKLISSSSETLSHK